MTPLTLSEYAMWSFFELWHVHGEEHKLQDLQH